MTAGWSGAGWPAVWACAAYTDVEKTAANVTKETKEATENAGAALGITPKVKNAITADAELNNTANEINVDSTKDTPPFEGGVAAPSRKCCEATLEGADGVVARAPCFKTASAT